MRSQASEKKLCVVKNHLYAKTVTYLSVSSKYPNNSVKLKCFLATGEYFSENERFDFEIALKLRPYCDIIGVDNSSENKYLKISKVLSLHAILHVAGGFL